MGIQEIFRWCYFLLIQRAEGGLNLVAKYPSSPYNKIEFGFGKKKKVEWLVGYELTTVGFAV